LDAFGVQLWQATTEPYQGQPVRIPVFIREGRARSWSLRVLRTHRIFKLTWRDVAEI